MLSIAQSMQRRGAAGVPLPIVFPSLAEAGVNICRSQVTLIVGPPEAGKSTLALNLLAKMGVPSLAFLLDTNELTASARFGAILTGDPFAQVKVRIIDGQGEAYLQRFRTDIPYIQASYSAPGADDVDREVAAYQARYGLPPDCVLIDNLGNQSSAFADEWAVLKALTLQYDSLARDMQCAVIATAHTTDLDSCEPAQRTKILGKISQYPRVILSVGFNPATFDYKVAVVKNTEGPSDRNALRPVMLHMDPARMLISEPPPMPTSFLKVDGVLEDRWWDK